MDTERKLRICHTIATVQFAASAALVIAWSLYASGVNWVALFSLSAQGVVLVALASLIYGFAIFRGAIGQRPEGEHPLTSSVQYRLFYLVVPILGGFLVASDYLVEDGPIEGVRGLALGTVMTAFVIWLFVDPLVGIAESALPESRRLRGLRRAAARRSRERHEWEKARLIEAILEKRRARVEALQPLVQERARHLAELLLQAANDPPSARDEATSLAFETWREGGLESLRALRSATAEICRKRQHKRLTEYLDFWWDGLGGLSREKILRH